MNRADVASHPFASDVTPTPTPSPGKVTSTSRLAPRVQLHPGAAVMRDAAPAPPALANGPLTDAEDQVGAMTGLGHADATHAWAAHGVAGASAPLPHAAAIQAAFGHHDVGGVRASIGGAASEASAAIGARAYATGDTVAFAAAPDLHLAAHEAAHVVQQRGDVRLSDGLGRAGDAYEQHADAVADHVVRGESAEALLDTMAHRGAAGGSAVQGKAIQRDEAAGAPATPTAAPTPAAPAAPAALPPPGTPSRVVKASGGYSYQQYADGTIAIVAGPTSVGKVIAPADPKNQMITSEIGPYVAPAAKAPAAAAPGAAAAPAATAPASDSPGLLDELGSAASSVASVITGAIGGAIGIVADALGGGHDAAATAAPAAAAPAPAAPASAASTAAAAPAGAAAPTAKPIDPANHQSRDTFIGKDLHENALTTQILDTIWPYFNQSDLAVAGYMNDEQLVWKVNFHWDEILWVVDTVSAYKDTSDDTKTKLAAVAAGLAGFAPPTGKSSFVKSKKLGDPKDTSQPAAFDARYAAVNAAKPQLHAILDAAGVLKKYPKDDEPGKSFQNACDHVNPPTTSTHGVGYALDIKGNEKRILATAAKLGMTGNCKEAYTHVEFAKGAHPPADAAAPAAPAAPAAKKPGT